MKKNLPTLVALSALTLSLSACLPEHRADGTYATTSSSTDASGTTIEKKSSAEVDTDEYGNKKTVVKTKTTKDPEGLMNKTTTSSTKKTTETTY